jgi:hypothetical protein
MLCTSKTSKEKQLSSLYLPTPPPPALFYISSFVAHFSGMEAETLVTTIIFIFSNNDNSRCNRTPLVTSLNIYIILPSFQPQQADALQIGHWFFSESHSSMHTKWWLCPHFSMPSLVPSSKSSYKFEKKDVNPESLCWKIARRQDLPGKCCTWFRSLLGCKSLSEQRCGISNTWKSCPPSNLCKHSLCFLVEQGDPSWHLSPNHQCTPMQN